MNILGSNSNNGRLRLAREIVQIAKRRKKKTPGEELILITRAARYVEESKYSEAIEDLDRFELVAKNLKPSERANIQSVQAELRRSGKFNLKKLIHESFAKFLFSKIYLQLYHLILSFPQILMDALLRKGGFNDFYRSTRQGCRSSVACLNGISASVQPSLLA